jgi:hypothetical protein
MAFALRGSFASPPPAAIGDVSVSFFCRRACFPSLRIRASFGAVHVIRYYPICGDTRCSGVSMVRYCIFLSPTCTCLKDTRILPTQNIPLSVGNIIYGLHFASEFFMIIADNQ